MDVTKTAQKFFWEVFGGAPGGGHLMDQNSYQGDALLSGNEEDCSCHFHKALLRGKS